jgi:hypothetical protein
VPGLRGQFNARVCWRNQYLSPETSGLSKTDDAFYKTRILGRPKRTMMYAAYTLMSKTNFTTTKFGTGPREMDLGLRHSF